jgi:hypothetical protein
VKEVVKEAAVLAEKEVEKEEAVLAEKEDLDQAAKEVAIEAALAAKEDLDQAAKEVVLAVVKEEIDLAAAIAATVEIEVKNSK